MLPPPDVLEAGPPLRRTAASKRKRTRNAPLPATAPAPAPIVDNKWLQGSTGSVASLNRLRSTRMKTAGGNY